MLHHLFFFCISSSLNTWCLFIWGLQLRVWYKCKWIYQVRPYCWWFSHLGCINPVYLLHQLGSRISEHSTVLQVFFFVIIPTIPAWVINQPLYKPSIFMTIKNSQYGVVFLWPISVFKSARRSNDGNRSRPLAGVATGSLLGEHWRKRRCVASYAYLRCRWC